MIHLSFTPEELHRRRLAHQKPLEVETTDAAMASRQVDLARLLRGLDARLRRLEPTLAAPRSTTARRV